MSTVLSHESGRIFRFLTAGGLSVLVYYSLLYGLTEFAGVWYISSATVAFIGYYVVHFFGQKLWAFRNKNMEYVKRQMVQCVILAVGNWILNTFSLYILVEYAHMWYMYAQGILSAAIAVVDYLALRYIFRRR